MTNPYVPPSFASYNFNANPPSDDGSQTIANTVSWNGNNGTAGVLSKIGNPLANYAQAVSSAANSAFGTLANQINTTLGVFQVTANTVPAMGVTVAAGELFGSGLLSSIAAQGVGAGVTYTGVSVSGSSVSGTISGIASMGGLGVGLTISGTNISGQASIFSVNFSGNSITINKAISISGNTSFSTLIPTPVTNPRIDLVSLTQSNGVAQYTQGIEAASPIQPGVPSGATPLATLSLTALTTIITSSNITDTRVLFPQGAEITTTGTISANQVAAFADNTGTLLKALAIITPVVKVIPFTVSGTSTYTPTTNMQNCIVFCTGGGAAGGAGNSNGNFGGGGGGGAGGTAIGSFTSTTISGPITVAVGGPGIVTTFGSLLTGNAGSGGGAGASTAGGSPGGGGTSVSGTSILPITGGDGATGTSGSSTDSMVSSGGSGGASFWGGGGGGGITNAGAGQIGKAFGSGGGGGAGGSGAGGAGKTGCVLVLEFVGGNTS